MEVEQMTRARTTTIDDEYGTLDGDPGEVLECVMSFASDALPGLGVVRTGTRLKREHEAVRAYPRAWVPASWPDDEKHARQAELGALGSERV
jgi:hypothetical protein